MPPESPFDATASLVGYLYQVRMALVLLLQRYRFDPGISISIEKFDDIAFHAGSDLIEQLQTKHVTHKTLSDSSTDLWKTLKIWCNRYRLGLLDPTSTNLVLLTTAEAPVGSAASYLRLISRDSDKACEILEEIVKKSISIANQSAYDEFSGLAKTKRVQLLKCIYVHDRSPVMLEVEKLLHKELRLITKASNIKALATRLEGWWLQITIEHLVGLRTRIAGDELELQIDDLREQFRLENLPIDYADVTIPGNENFDNRAFLRQVSLINISSKRMTQAILDYYRATKQRGRWISDQLIAEQELKNYERKLMEIWSEVFESKIQASDGTNDIDIGRAIYDFMMISKEILLRPSCTESFVMRGTYHMLAEALLVGWHPQFKALLSAPAAARP